MRHNPESERLSLINRHNLRNHEYTQSLTTEALRVHLISMSVVDDLQMQIMGQLEELIRREEEQGRSVAGEEQANAMLAGIFFVLDTCLLAYHDPMYALAELQGGSISAMYQNGLKLLKNHFYETVSLWVRVRHSAPISPGVAYETVTGTEVRQALYSYDPVRRATLPTPTYSYPLANQSWQEHTSLFATKYYLKYLLSENRFCAHFSSQEQLLVQGGNRFEAVANIALANAALGKFTGTLHFSEEDLDTLAIRLQRRASNGIREMFRDACTSLMDDFGNMFQSESTYLKWYCRHLADMVIRNSDQPEQFFRVNS